MTHETTPPNPFRYLDAERTTVVMEAADWAFPAADLYRYGGEPGDVLPYDAAWTAARERAREAREAERQAAAAARTLLPALAASATLPDAAVVATARVAPDFFPAWTVGQVYAAGARLRYGESLVLVAQTVTAQAHQPPLSTGMSAVYRAFSLHAGTREDPIPFQTDMNATAGEYYTHAGQLWRCTADLHPAHIGREPGAAGLDAFWQKA